MNSSTHHARQNIRVCPQLNGNKRCFSLSTIKNELKNTNKKCIILYRS